MKHTTAYTAILAIAGLFLSACGGAEVGRRCFPGNVVGDNVVSSSATECAEKICLKYPIQEALPPGGENTPMCSARCESADECERVSDSPCQQGFTCGVATPLGDFCCEKLCICKDFLDDDSDEVPVPLACKSNEARVAMGLSECANL